GWVRATRDPRGCAAHGQSQRRHRTANHDSVGERLSDRQRLAAGTKCEWGNLVGARDYPAGIARGRTTIDLGESTRTNPTFTAEPAGHTANRSGGGALRRLIQDPGAIARFSEQDSHKGHEGATGSCAAEVYGRGIQGRQKRRAELR